MTENALLSGVEITIEDIFGEVEPYRRTGTASEVRYPEILLQDSEHGYKYYGCCQRHSRQFIDSNGAIVRWRNSTVERLQSAVIEQSFLGPQSKKWSESSGGRSYSKPTSSALFSWSSSEAYIQTRKLELMKKGKKGLGVRTQGNSDSTVKAADVNNGTASVADPPVKGTESILKRHNLGLPPKLITDLNYVIDTESNKFIHDRIQVIKAHHSEEMSKQINERKRRDHEQYLQRVKLKEEQYERELRAATEEKEKEKSNKFLGLFSFSHSENNTVVDDKKRFSFLPTMFGVAEKKSETEPAKDSKEGKEEGAKEGQDAGPVEKEDEETIDAEAEPKQKEVPTKEEPKMQNPQPEPIPIIGQQLDLLFASATDSKAPASKLDDVEEFDDFQTSPPPPEKKETTLNHRFMPISEPKPLIDFEDA